MTCKFKKGDKIIVAYYDMLQRAYPDVYTVTECIIEAGGPAVMTEEKGAFLLEWMELESVVNSPLYKALS